MERQRQRLHPVAATPVPRTRPSPDLRPGAGATPHCARSVSDWSDCAHWPGSARWPTAVTSMSSSTTRPRIGDDPGPAGQVRYRHLSAERRGGPLPTTTRLSAGRSSAISRSGHRGGPLPSFLGATTRDSCRVRPRSCVREGWSRRECLVRVGIAASRAPAWRGGGGGRARPSCIRRSGRLVRRRPCGRCRIAGLGVGSQGKRMCVA